MPSSRRIVGFFLLSQLLLSSSSSVVSALDFKRALLSGLEERVGDNDDSSTVSTTTTEKPPKRKRQKTTDNNDNSMGQCLSSLTSSLQQDQQDPATQQAVNDVWDAAGQATADAELVHANLPNDAIAAKVRNVYDGDTLTLTDYRRVRLVGIDTPEIKGKQLFAQEAKAYTKDRCDHQQVWISSAGKADSEQTDHYGRLLALVWIKAPGGYLCINEGIVSAGLARVYRPTTSTTIVNWKTLLQLQATARRKGLGVWQNFDDAQVVMTTNGSAYHKPSCQHVAHSKHLTTVRISVAMEQGLHPCRTCLA